MAKKEPDRHLIGQLLDAGASPAAVSSRQGNTALHVLAQSSNTPADILFNLMGQLTRAGTTDLLASNAEGNTPLHLALQAQSELSFALLDKGGYSNKRNLEGSSPMDIAKAMLAETQITAAFSYSAEQMREVNPGQVMLQRYQKAECLYRATLNAHRDRTRRVRVHFAEPSADGDGGQRLAAMERQLARAQSYIDAQWRIIARLESKLSMRRRPGDDG